MKLINFIIFLSIVLAVHGAVNYYIFIRGWQVLPREPAVRIPYLAIFLIFALSYLAGRVLERFTICAASDYLIWIGSFWMGMMVYLFLGALLCDILRLGNWIAGVVPVPSELYGRIRQMAALAVTAVAAATVIAGYFNTLHPRINTVVVEVPKSAGGRRTLDIALVTDIHLGTIIKNSRLQTMADMVNVLQPDLVLLGGDIVDEDLAPVIQNNLGELLRTIRSRYGTYAVTGNHEYIGGVEAACRYLSDHGVTVLRDRSVLIDNSFYLVGREDRSITQFGGGRRLPLDSVMKGVDLARPVIMMDHQPFRLGEAAEHGVDLQVSGHTHHGQLWPFNFITSLIYEVSRGLKRIGNTHVFVSCGYGTWGPPVRVGMVPEVVHLQLRFKQ
ncbi:MAG TPA: metallophosphoesterase [Spirochaetota bacterium]|nr:metallophosphoesterase [Spirochaetota bacterium]HPC41183.1 metallophosphoesterase [Spirochaetota bacterium]HPL17124.1 metallophosphoesterase [Spirochaetota bacterium]HQF07103.1 metallophosphoesterase [Spirochaetota bacterium]HQH95840.1 metallophosphoesterase [Spirochaetota bacterium]